MVSGFVNAPLSKGLLLTTNICSLVAALLELKPWCHLQLYPHISVHHQYWRLFTFHLAFTNSREVFVFTLLFYTVSVSVERTFGTRKFASFILLTTLLLSLTTFLSLLLLPVFLFPIPRFIARSLYSITAQGYVPAGPFGVLFAILYQWYRMVPNVWTIKVGGWELGNKATVYVLAGLLATSQFPASLLASSLGLLISSLYRSDLLGLSTPLKAYRIPPRLYTFLADVLRPLIGSTRMPPRSVRVSMDQRRDGSERAERAGGPGSARRPEGDSGLSTGSRAGLGRSLGALAPATGRLSRRHGRTTWGSLTGLRPIATGLGAGAADGEATAGRSILPLANPLASTARAGAAEADGDEAQPPRSALREYFTQLAGEATTGPSETDVRVLHSIFPMASREQVVQALQNSNGEPTRAVDTILHTLTNS